MFVTIEVWLWYILFFEQYLSTFFCHAIQFNNGEVFRLSVFVMNSQTWTIFYFWQYTLFFGLFVFIHFSCSWVTKYLECESLCSSCTRTEIIAMIIKKNMTKLYMHHFCGGRVYCCIVTHENTFVFKENHLIEMLCFVPWVQYVLSFCACIII